MNVKKKREVSVLLLLTASLAFPVVTASETDMDQKPVIFSNIAQSEKRILKDDPARDEKLRLLTENDRLTNEVLEGHSLIVGSNINLVCRNMVYSWLVDNITISAELSRLFGRKYVLSEGSQYQYHGDDGEGLTIDFYRAYRDSNTTVFAGVGNVKIFLVTISGSFVNFMEYYDTDKTTMTSRSCIYVRVNNPVTRLFTNIIFAISDLERGIMKKILSLDDTVYKMADTVMHDPHFYLMLKDPGKPPPKEASKLVVKMKNTVVRESSPEHAREFGLLIEHGRKAYHEKK